MASTTKKTAVKNNADAGMDLRDLIIMKVRALYCIESELLKALPAMAKKATDADLRSVFEEHAEQTEDHVKRLLRICEILGVKAQKVQGEGIRGLIAETDWIVKNIKNAAGLDVALIAAACSIEHHEIAGYESAIAWAKFLEKDEIADLLGQTLEEEDDTNEELNDLAELKINEKAMPEGIEEDEEDESADDDADEKNSE